MNKRTLFFTIAMGIVSILLINNALAQTQNANNKPAQIKGPSAPMGFSISPLRIDLSTKQTVQAVTVTNFTSESGVFQVELKKWDRKNGQDVYTDTRDILASPPIFKIDPTQQQIIRVGLRKPNTSNQELSYRIFLRQIQTKVNTDPASQSKSVQMLVRLGVPVFVEPATIVKQLNWTVSQVSDNTLKVDIQNGGNTHISISQLSVTPVGEKDKPLGSVIGGAYILPNQSKALTIKLTTPLPSKTVHILAKTNQGDIESDVTIK